MKQYIGLIFISVSSIITLLMPSQVVAKTGEQTKQVHKSYRATKKVPAMRNRVYTQLARAQKLNDEGDKEAGLAVLANVEEKVDSLNGYEQAMLYNFYGFMYYANDDINHAILSFNKVISNEAVIPDSLLLSTRYSLAQLSMQQQDYSSALRHLTAWKNANKKPLMASQEMLFAQMYYQDKQYINSLIHIENAIKITKTEEKTPKENWLILKRAVHYELEQPKKVTQVLEQLVRLYSKPKYWLQLAGMYGEIGEENRQIAVMEAAYQAGNVTKSNDIITLAQLYQFHGAPYKAATLLDEAIEQGIVDAQEKNLDLLARSYLSAKEFTKAIKVLNQLSQLSESGQYDALLAQTYLNTEQWQYALTSADKAITKSKDDNDKAYLGNMYLVKGMANFNLKVFDESLSAFALAEQVANIKKTAQQWKKYVVRERNSFQQQKLRLAMLK